MANKYLSSFVRIQKDRDHQVSQSGPYCFVRHPLYISDILFYPLASLFLGSLLALVPAALIMAVFVIQTYLEDTTLKKELDGYLEYSKKVKYQEYEEIWNAAPYAMDLQEGIHFEFGFTQNSAFVIETKGRYAKFTDLSGTLEYESRGSVINTSGTEEDALLWYGIWHRSGGEYPEVLISESGENWIWSTERKGEVNLNSIVFQAGLKLTF
jgi:hypothetical protein